MKIQLNAAARLQSVEAEAELEAGFHDWSKQRQEKYLKDHPGSKYSPGYKPKARKPSEPYIKPAAKPSHSTKEAKGPAEKQYNQVLKQVQDIAVEQRRLEMDKSPLGGDVRKEKIQKLEEQFKKLLPRLHKLREVYEEEQREA